MSWISRLFGRKDENAQVLRDSATPAPPAPPAAVPSDAEVWMQAASEEAQARRYEASLYQIETLHKIDPGHAAGWNLKAAVLAGLHRFEESADAVERYLRLAPASDVDKIQTAKGFLRNLQWVNTSDDELDVEGLCGKAVTLHKFGQSAEAVRSFDRALAIDATSLQAWNDRALALEALGRKEEALESYDRALASKPDAAAVWFNRGNLLSSLGRGSEAQQSYRKFVQGAPPELQHLVKDAKSRLERLARAADPAIAERCEGLRACDYPQVLNMAKTYLNMFGMMKPPMLDCIIVDTCKLLDVDPQNHGALALLGYASLAMQRASEGAPYFQRAKADGSGAAALCGAYFGALTSFRKHIEENNTEAAGNALAEAMVTSVKAFADAEAFKLDMKSLEFGHCIIVSTAHGGLVVPVQGHEGRFQRMTG